MGNYKPQHRIAYVGTHDYPVPITEERPNKLITLYANPLLATHTNTFSLPQAGPIDYKVPDNKVLRVLQISIVHNNVGGLVSIVSGSSTDTATLTYFTHSTRTANGTSSAYLNFTIAAASYVTYITGGANAFSIQLLGVEEDV